MLLIRCDYHPSVQQIAMLDTEREITASKGSTTVWRSGEVLPRSEATQVKPF